MIESRNDQYLWVEKYRPQKIDDCILPEAMKNTFKQYLAQGEQLVLVRLLLLKHYAKKLAQTGL